MSQHSPTAPRDDDVEAAATHAAQGGSVLFSHSTLRSSPRFAHSAGLAGRGMSRQHTRQVPGFLFPFKNPLGFLSALFLIALPTRDLCKYALKPAPLGP